MEDGVQHSRLIQRDTQAHPTPSQVQTGPAGCSEIRRDAPLFSRDCLPGGGGNGRKGNGRNPPLACFLATEQVLLSVSSPAEDVDSSIHRPCSRISFSFQVGGRLSSFRGRPKIQLSQMTFCKLKLQCHLDRPHEARIAPEDIVLHQDFLHSSQRYSASLCNGMPSVWHLYGTCMAHALKILHAPSATELFSLKSPHGESQLFVNRQCRSRPGPPDSSGTLGGWRAAGPRPQRPAPPSGKQASTLGVQ